MQKITTFYEIEGVDPAAKFDSDTPLDIKAVIARRKRAEFEVAKIMVGAKRFI